MDSFFNSLLFFWTAYIVSNLLAFGLAYGSFRFPGITRLALFLLFVWAFWINTTTALESPWVYRDYADSAILPFKNFILELSERSMKLLVLVIAFGQLLIAVSMLLRGTVFKMGCWAGIVFGLVIAPLGLYAGFPATLMMALAFYQLYRRNDILYFWIRD